MTNKKTIRALMLALVAVLLCAAMLVGATFAWFTESVSSVNNLIVSGNLDVEVQFSSDLKDWKTFEEGVNVFDENALWEPGYTEVVYLKVKNAGSLALKYWLDVQVFTETPSINQAGEEFYLSNFIKYGVVTLTEDADGNAAPFKDRDAAHDAVVQKATWINAPFMQKDVDLGVDEADYIALVAYMPQTVGNDANHAKDAKAPTIELGITLRATQDTVEYDSFDEKYDESATYPKNPYGFNYVYTEEDLKQGGALKLANDLTLTAFDTVIDQDTVLDLNGYSITANRNYVAGLAGQTTASITVLTVSGAELTIKGEGTVKNTAPEGAYAVTLQNGAKVNIEGGYYESYHDAIYVHKGELSVSGGFFRALGDVTPYADFSHPSYPLNPPCFTAEVINCHKDSYNNRIAKVTVTGGTFVNEDPTNIREGYEINVQYTAPGYKSEVAPQANGEVWYTVVPE